MSCTKLAYIEYLFGFLNVYCTLIADLFINTPHEIENEYDNVVQDDDTANDGWIFDLFDV